MATTKKGFTVKITSDYPGWWRYNAALMAGCFDAEERRTEFATVCSHVADVGAELKEPPADMARDRKITLTTAPCDHLQLYAYIIPHTLPSGDDIDATQPFDIELTIAYGGRRVNRIVRKINQWSGASIEMRVEKVVAR
ncbi:MAG: hypothetical protein K2O55_00025 [Alistipes sp.]|nr:hypothetical protein [Alistipes sp.]